MLSRFVPLFASALLLVGCGGGGVNLGNENPNRTVRKSVERMTAQEKLDFVNTLKAMKNVSSAFEPEVTAYDYFVALHMEAFSPEHHDEHVHGGWQFLPWHREFLRRFESEMARVSNGKVRSLPYWDWTSRGSLAAVFSDDFLGGDGDPSDNDLVKTGPFRAGEWPVRFTDLTTGDFGGPVDENLPEGIERTIGRTPGVTNLPTAAQAGAVMSIPNYDVEPYDHMSPARRSARKYLEAGADGTLGMHNLVHVYVGGEMNSGSSPNDPAFFLHHANIDRLWARWQARHPDATLPRDMMTHPMFRFGGKTVVQAWNLRDSGVSYDDLR
jgi:tyrosinase